MSSTLALHLADLGLFHGISYDPLSHELALSTSNCERKRRNRRRRRKRNQRRRKRGGGRRKKKNEEKEEKKEK